MVPLEIGYARVSTDDGFLLGYNEGFRDALLKATEVIRRQRMERGRSDVNATKAITAILELNNA